MRRKARQVMRWLEIAHLSGREVSQMSSGEVRRVMIARALVHSPRALLFDEPSNSLDVIAQMELRQTMRKLAVSGLTLLLITHHLPDVVPEIGRVLFLREGAYVADGPKDKLLTARKLGELFGTAVGITRRDGLLSSDQLVTVCCGPVRAPLESIEHSSIEAKRIAHWNEKESHVAPPL